MQFRKTIAAIAASILLSTIPAAAKTSTVETAGKAVAIALPIAAGGVSLFKKDWNGLGELFLVTAATAATAYGLKYVVHEERPDHSDMKSFPSDQAALAFAPASYLWDRYGWRYGAPAYLAAGFVGYARVDAKRHHWWDVGASAGIAWLYSRIITTTYHPPHNFYSALSATPHGAYISLHYRF